MKKIGIKDLMKAKRISVNMLQEELIGKNALGNWETYQNVYNLVNGRMPRDTYVFIVISNLLEIELSQLLLRYSKNTKIEKSNNIIRGSGIIELEESLNLESKIEQIDRKLDLYNNTLINLLVTLKQKFN